jgi:hypothetical protein
MMARLTAFLAVDFVHIAAQERVSWIAALPNSEEMY